MVKVWAICVRFSGGSSLTEPAVGTTYIRVGVGVLHLVVAVLKTPGHGDLPHPPLTQNTQQGKYNTQEGHQHAGEGGGRRPHCRVLVTCVNKRKTMTSYEVRDVCFWNK